MIYIYSGTSNYLDGDFIFGVILLCLMIWIGKEVGLEKKYYNVLGCHINK